MPLSKLEKKNRIVKEQCSEHSNMHGLALTNKSSVAVFAQHYRAHASGDVDLDEQEQSRATKPHRLPIK